MKRTQLRMSATGKKVKRTPFHISAAVTGTSAQVKITGYISGWKDNATDFESTIDELITAGITKLAIYIRTEGGSVFEANEIFNILKRFPGSIEISLGALCASAGTYLACLPGAKVTAVKNIQYMIHKPVAGLYGNEDVLESTLKALRLIQAEYLEVYAAKTGMTKEAIAELWAKGDYWMNAEELKNKGFINSLEGEDELVEEDIESLQACGYKNIPYAMAAAAVGKRKDNPQNENLKTTDMKGVNAVLAIKDGATEAEAISAIEALKVKAAKADKLEKDLKDAEEKALDEKAEAEVTAAITAKKITADQKEFFKANLIGNFEATKKVLDGITGVVKISGMINPQGTGSSEDRSKWTFEDYQEKDPKALAALHESDAEAFEKLYKAHYGKK